MQVRPSAVELVEFVYDPSVGLDEATGAGQRREAVLHLGLFWLILNEYFERELVVVLDVVHLISVVQAPDSKVDLLFEMLVLGPVVLVHYAVYLNFQVRAAAQGCPGGVVGA